MAARPRKAALAWLAFLGPFFFASYGLANWLASRRAGVGAVVFDWEHAIPFLAWTIVPYWSIDLLYGASLFVPATRRELGVHARRLLCAQVLAVACFLAFPLRFTFPRPEADGLFGLMLDVLAGFDQPFNQAPSLHIALLVILWVLYARHLSGAARWALHAWFTLIGVSVLTTYQHHFIDLPTGIWLGWLCVWLLPEGAPSLLGSAAWTKDPVRLRLAARYAAAGAGCAALALYLGGAFLWLLYVSGALVLVGLIYGCLSEAAFQKGSDGRLSSAAWWLLAPYIAGAWINSRWWTRSAAGASLLAPGLLIGRMPTRRERDLLGVRAIVDLSAELPCPGEGVHYASVPQLDLAEPSLQQLERAAGAIEAALGNGPALVCCALGFSRSATAVAAWMIASGRAADAAEAIERIRAARPAIVLGERHVVALGRFALRRGAQAA